MIGRRGFLTGLISLVAAPAIVRAGSLMPVKVIDLQPYGRSPLIEGLQMMKDLEEIHKRIERAFLIPVSSSIWADLNR